VDCRLGLSQKNDVPLSPARPPFFSATHLLRDLTGNFHARHGYYDGVERPVTWRPRVILERIAMRVPVAKPLVRRISRRRCYAISSIVMRPFSSRLLQWRNRRPVEIFCQQITEKLPVLIVINKSLAGNFLSSHRCVFRRRKKYGTFLPSLNHRG